MGKKKKKHKKQNSSHMKSKSVSSVKEHDQDIHTDKEVVPHRRVSPNNQFTTQISFRISAEQKDFLKHLSVDSGRTLNEIVRGLIDRLRTGEIQIEKK